MLYNPNQESKRPKKQEGDLIYKTVVPSGENASTLKIPVHRERPKHEE
jgi:hypothetical protein